MRAEGRHSPDQRPARADTAAQCGQKGLGRAGESIVGTVRNDSGNSYGYVQVEFNLYDKSGHGLGSTLAKTSRLGPGGTWDFAAPVRKKQAYRYKVDDVTGY